MSTVLESALDAVIGMDANGRISEWNQRSEEIFGWPRAEVVGRPLAEILLPERYRDAHRAGLSRYLATGAGPILNRRLEIEALHRDGHEFMVELAVTPLDLAGTPHFTAVLRDISERHRLERQRRELFEMAGHDLKTPLTVIRGRLQLARRLLGGPTVDVDRVLDDAERQVERMLVLIRDLLDVSRFTIGEIPVRPERLDLRGSVGDAAARHGTGVAGGALHAAVPDQPVFVAADRLRLEQVLDNLISNARRYSRAPDSVVIALAVERTEALVRVRDDGPGIAAADQDRLFEPNFARSYGGTGLGLHISRRIAERHGGRLWLEETGPAGSTFTLALPLAQSE